MRRFLLHSRSVALGQSCSSHHGIASRSKCERAPRDLRSIAFIPSYDALNFFLFPILLFRSQLKMLSLF
ncbi:MAG: hypothetical protein F6K50_31480 [Moorea sp. SIO3I7]|uniref:hypothetical protein n=1 Tax=Moorena sp. SIO3I8 TaxID=2607833 RepID=UPI0013C2961A|nr:hypothetical protein [Moorena sp. SIO3I8]NEN99835.1 hypothetical protein [Moorena sp. SIO3I7]NEO07626.1 hypothetical protein [Moorena sp. SIO3I8]